MFDNPELILVVDKIRVTAILQIWYYINAYQCQWLEYTWYDTKDV